MRRRNKQGCLPPRGKVAEAPPEEEALETQKRGRFRALFFQYVKNIYFAL